jgi:fermentation-respiration switch protein FrsA (DUF1100 family)
MLAPASATILLGGCMLRSLIYFPSPGPVELPPGEAFRDLREVRFHAADGVALEAWHWPAPARASGAETLVIFHGNAGHRGHRLEWLARLRETGRAIFIIDYRGYGGSAGSPSEEGLYADAEGAVAWLEEHGAGPLVYVGESIGTGVAVELARRRPPRALVLQSPFTSLGDVARFHYPYLPARLLLCDRFDSIAKIEAIRCPLLVIHGERDSIIPVDHGRAIHERAGGPKEWFEIPGADHNDALWLEPDYVRRWVAFLDRN